MLQIIKIFLWVRATHLHPNEFIRHALHVHAYLEHEDDVETILRLVC